MEAEIKIGAELAAKGFKKALRFQIIKNIALFYGQAFLLIWVFLLICNGVMDASRLNIVHFLLMFGLWIIATAISYYYWEKEIDNTKGWSFHAKLDETGVIVNQTNEMEWSFYKSYKEFEEYIEIEDINGNFTFLPREPGLFRLIEYTKEKIPNKKK